MRAMILAAGFGSRLKGLSDERPKPLLPVSDIPLIRYAIALLRGHGIRELVINLHHRGELIEEELGDGRALDVKITYSREEIILGTGGGIRRVSELLTNGGRDPFWVVNGKILIDVDLHAALSLHQSSGALATMVLKETPDAAKWGAIEIAEDGRITRMLGHGTPGRHACMFTGVHLFSPELVARLPPEGESDSIRDGYLPALASGERLVGYLCRGYFHEHSTPARYLDGNFRALDGRAQIRYPPGPLTGKSPSAEIAPGATLLPPFRIGDGASIASGAVVGPYAVVGARSTLGSHARIVRSVVWPDTRLDEPVASAIVTPRGIQPGIDSDGRS